MTDTFRGKKMANTCPLHAVPGQGSQNTCTYRRPKGAKADPPPWHGPPAPRSRSTCPPAALLEARTTPRASPPLVHVPPYQHASPRRRAGSAREPTLRTRRQRVTRCSRPSRRRCSRGRCQSRCRCSRAASPSAGTARPPSLAAAPPARATTRRCLTTSRQTRRLVQPSCTCGASHPLRRRLRALCRHGACVS